jgi:hypothetical protein
MKIKIEKLQRPEQCGDWHDKLLKWVVIGPGAEVQKFPTKLEAIKYKRIRSKAKTENAAHVAFVLAP